MSRAGEGSKHGRPCVLCGSVAHRVLFHSPDRRFGIQGEFSVAQCCRCGLMFQHPLPDPTWAREVHGTAMPSPTRIYAAYRYLVNRSRVRFLRSLRPPGKLLDVGCGDGSFLLSARSEGWECTGTEVSPEACTLARSRSGIHVHLGELQELSLPERYFDVVTLHHVFEHIPNPDEFLQNVSRVLYDDGILVVEVPHVNNIVFKIFRGYYYHIDVPRHSFFYKKDTLLDILRRYGFRMLKVDAPSWHYPEGIAESTLLWLQARGLRGKVFKSACYGIMALPTLIYLTLTLGRLSSEVVRVAAVKAPV